MTTVADFNARDIEDKSYTMHLQLMDAIKAVSWWTNFKQSSVNVHAEYPTENVLTTLV